ncbi:MAG TPA: response regulator [Chitinophagaceae bacterium]|nr:response regulator [Chitinophagaceae bacterium]
MKEILLVEDDALYSKILSYMLENSGFIVDCASNGMQGMEMADAKKYDLIITDIFMPLASGLDLVSHVRTRCAVDDCKVLVMSIMSSDYYWSESIARGANDYLKKPVKAKDFMQTVKRLLYAAAA